MRLFRSSLASLEESQFCDICPGSCSTNGDEICTGISIPRKRPCHHSSIISASLLIVTPSHRVPPQLGHISGLTVLTTKLPHVIQRYSHSDIAFPFDAAQNRIVFAGATNPQTSSSSSSPSKSQRQPTHQNMSLSTFYLWPDSPANIRSISARRCGVAVHTK